MDNLKKNLHFVVFGAGVFIGILLLGVGMYIRSGTESSLETEQGSLKGLKDIQSKGNLEEAKKRAGEFDKSLDGANKALNEMGSIFTNNYQQKADGRQFYSEEANQKLKQLNDRFKAMERPVKLPALLADWTFSTGSQQQNVWQQLEQDMTNPPVEKIREMQMRLRFLDEVATAMEKLIEAGADDGMGVKLRDLKFPSGFSPSANSELESPWMVLPMELQFDCAPGFVLMLADELANPSQLTLTDTVPSEAGKPVFKRLGFPILVDQMQTVMMGRQHEMKYFIANEDKGGVIAKLNSAMGTDEQKIPVPPDPAALNGANPDGARVVEEAGKNLNEKDRLLLPVQAALKIKAAALNRNWRAIKEKTDQNQ